jgi:D-methionine transport system permease protein
MGATPWQVVRKAYIPEVGDMTIRYGYQRFRPGVTLCTVAVRVAMVQTIQYVGDALARRVQR